MTVAVFDTNVVVSGVLSPTGAPGRILDAILDGFCRPGVTDAILAEYEDVLNRPKFRFPSAKISLLLDAIRSRAAFAPFASCSTGHALPDPDDAIFVEAALGLHAPIVTGNLRHFPARAIGGIPVLSPSAFIVTLGGPTKLDALHHRECGGLPRQGLHHGNAGHGLRRPRQPCRG